MMLSALRPRFEGNLNADKTGTSSEARFNRYPGMEPGRDTFQLSHVAAANPAVTPYPMQPLASITQTTNPFSLSALGGGTTAASLAQRITNLIRNPEHGTSNAKMLLDAASDNLPKKVEKWSATEREAHEIVQAARRLDNTAKLDLISRLSGGADSVASELAATSLRENRKIGLNEFLSAWAKQPWDEASGLGGMMPALGAGLLALNVALPAGSLSPTLTNGLVNNISALSL
ncbi:MAG TPA: hypothetical protein V6C99_11435 [Oculatellaceae cyanobacterium]